MELLSQIVDWIHGATITIIIAIIGMTMAMSVFLYKILFDGDFFSDYNRNL